MKATSSDDKNVNLLWTGGWDSTFHLLQLLIIHKLRVTPFYLIDEARGSTGVEIQTMKRIRNRLFKKYPHTRDLLRPTQYFGVPAILPDPEIEEASKTIRKEKFMGPQCDWLARFCKQNSITDMQLCIHRGDKAHLVIENIVSEERDDSLSVVRVDRKFNMTNEYTLFRYFSFPIFSLSKVQMATIANEQGWEQEMGLTWFCHNPRKGMKPCGECNPCISTIEEGLAWRIPASSRVSSFFHGAFSWPVKRIVKHMLNKVGLLKLIRRSAYELRIRVWRRSR
jgi:hypothetical protein